MGCVRGCVEELQTRGKQLTLAWHGTEGHFEKINDDDDESRDESR